MRRSFRSRAAWLLTLGLITALPPLAAQASAPDAAAAAPLGAVSDLVGTATDALTSLGDTIDATARTVVDTVSPAAGPCSGFGSLDAGDDGRLTILLLGSDYRTKHYIGERMDVIIVATRRSDGRVAMASIPRDMVAFPKAGGGTSGAARVNTMYYSYRRAIRYDRVDCRALRKFTQDVAVALATEIDYYAMVRMATFIQLVDNVKYVPVDVPGPIVDTSYGRRGLYFPDKDDYRLVGNTGCRPRPSECHSALAYVRSRHGTQAGSPNNDFKRAYRQHDFILDAARRVRSRGDGAALSSLMDSIIGKVWTNVPKNITVARDVYDLIGDIRLSGSDSVVFGPTRYATSRGAPLYTFRPKLARIRTWVDTHFGS